MNKEQFDIITAKLKIKDKRKLALHDVIFSGISAYAAEKKRGTGEGVVMRNFIRVNEEFDYIEEVRKAGIEYIYTNQTNKIKG